MPIDKHELDRMTGWPWTHKVPPTCPACGYNLTGLSSTRCPECGTVTPRKEIDQLASDLDAQLIWLRGINDVPRAGLGVVIGSAVLGVLAWVLGLSAFARVFGLLGGLVAIAMGLSVLRALRAPAEVRERLATQPNYALGLSVAALGVVLVAASIVL